MLQLHDTGSLIYGIFNGYQPRWFLEAEGEYYIGQVSVEGQNVPPGGGRAGSEGGSSLEGAALGILQGYTVMVVCSWNLVDPRSCVGIPKSMK